MDLTERLKDLSQKSSDEIMELAHTLFQGQCLPLEEETIHLAEELSKLPHPVVKKFFKIIDSSCFAEKEKISDYSERLSKHLHQVVPHPLLAKMIRVALGEASFAAMSEPQSPDAAPPPENPHTDG
jgi:hypothetical protein